MLGWIKDKFASIFIGKYQAAIERTLTTFLFGALGKYGLDQGSAAIVSVAVVGFLFNAARSLYNKATKQPIDPPPGEKIIAITTVPNGLVVTPRSVDSPTATTTVIPAAKQPGT